MKKVSRLGGSVGALGSLAFALAFVLAPAFTLVVASVRLARAEGSGSGGGTPARSEGFMGVRLEPAPNGGLRVAEVTAGSPAASAGVRNGDVIVQARGGDPGSVQMFTTSVRSAGGGATYPIVLMRGTQRITLQVVLGRSGMAAGAPPPSLNAQVVMGSGPGDLAQLRGRVVVLDFWASWCGPCRMVMPVLNRMHQRYAAQGLSVVGISDESPAIARSVGTAMSISYTLATDPSAQRRFGVTSLPTMVVLDRAGTIRRITVGVEAGELRRLDGLIQQLLAEPARP